MGILNLVARALGRPEPQVGMTPCDVVHRENKWRLLRYRGLGERAPSRFATPVLLIPSLINRHYVLDLMPGKSFVEHMVAQGHDVFCIDWGTPTDEDRFVTFDDICDKIIARAIRVTARHGSRGAVHVLGYCLGGTLATIHAAVRPERIASLTLVAAPVRFDDDEQLATWTRTRTFDVRAIADASGNVPAALMQGAFHLLRPTLTLSKAVALANRAWDDRFLDGFFALETWGNDNVSFPGACYVTYIEELYRGDALRHGEFALSGERVLMSNLAMPLHVCTFEHDNIVPRVAAVEILEHAQSRDVVHRHLPGGHVGAMVSSAAKKHLWPLMSEFWAERDAEAKAPRARKKRVS